ncbi:MAG: hypothetical protein M3460_02180 [Actinomycetota bacterium]|nr:hypothetical protein [Actinomycetota bacterium]
MLVAHGDDGPCTYCHRPKLLLTRYCGWELPANDRIFVRADTGEVQILPWPAAAAIGLGLLDALADSATHDQARATAREQLACLPHHAVTLSHDITANIDVLGKIAASVSSKE